MVKHDTESNRFYKRSRRSLAVALIGLVAIGSSCCGNAQRNAAALPADLRVYDGEEFVWSEEFDGNTLNTEVWGHDTNIHVNNELQKYSATQSVVDNGVLTITAIKVGDNQQYGDYLSGRVYSKGKKEFTHGRMEIRAKLPAGVGTWPALWMLGGNIDAVDWPACGEIDIMEHVGFDPGKVHSTLHNTSSWGASVNGGFTMNPTFDTDFHIYGMNWDGNKMDFYIDDPTAIYYTYAPEIKNGDTWPFDQPFFFILNLAIGGHWGGAQGVDDSIFPVSMEVDYVRVYQPKK